MENGKLIVENIEKTLVSNDVVYCYDYTVEKYN